jgi:hypothetical protein
MSYVQFLEVFVSVMLVLPLFGNLGVLVFRNSHPKVAYFFFRMSAIAVAVAKEPKDKQIVALAGQLVEEVKQSPLPETEPASLVAAKLEPLVADEPKSPALPPGVSLLLVLALGGLVGGCAASEKLIETLHDVEDLNDAQTQIADEAKPCFIAEADRAEAACKGEATCIATVRANANRRADLYDTVHAKQCKLNPLLEGCAPARVPR